MTRREHPRTPWNVALAVVAVLGSNGCAGPRPPVEAPAGLRATGGSGGSVDPNRAMADYIRRHFDDLLANRVRTLEFNPANSRRLPTLKADWEKAAPGAADAFRLHMTYAVELAHAAHYEDAVAELEAIRRDLDRDPGLKKKYLPAVLDYLGISHLLLGEQRHERREPSGDDMILPIRGGGVHRDGTEARAAAGIYREMLERDPGDRTARWLLNVAAQMSGDYPAGVPAAWLIPPDRFASDALIPRFRNVAREAGVSIDGHSGGAVMDDFTNDGLLDLVVSSEGYYDSVRFLVNKGDGTFEDRTHAAGLDGIGYSLNITAADYDNDGWMDILVMRGGWSGLSGTGVGNVPLSLLHNNGDGTFTDVTVKAGLASPHPRQTAVWFDYDNDGHLDLFLGNETTPWWLPGIKGGVHPVELFHNRGDGTFEEVAAEVGLDFTAWVKGAAAGDFNNDGFPDLYVSTFLGRNRLYENRLVDGRRRFVEVTKQAGVAEPFQGFATWFFDYDNDGNLDIMALGFRPFQPWQKTGKHRQDAMEAMARYFVGEPKNASQSETHLYRNRGDGTFEDVSVAAGVQRFLTPMGANFGDLDNDGYPDFFLGTGNPNIWTLDPDRMFLNDGGKRFLDVTTAGGFGSLYKGHGICFGDIDNDGQRDVYITRGGFYEADISPNALFMNPGNANSWIVVRLEGRKSNRSAIGSRLAFAIDEGGKKRTVHWTTSSGGSFGSNPLRNEVGLGRAKKVETLDIRWPSGLEQQFRDVAVNRFYHLVEGGTLVPDERVEKTKSQARH